jgi:hypothetical protein
MTPDPVAGQLALDDAAEPISGETEATVDLVGRDWRAEEDWRRFREACLAAAAWSGEVDPNDVRTRLTRDGELTIAPRRLSAFYHRAAGRDGFLEFSHWGTNGDVKGRNAGRPARIYKWRASA